MTPTECKEAMKSLKTSQDAIAESLGVSRTKLTKAAKTNPIPVWLQFSLEALAKRGVESDFSRRLVGERWTDQIARAAIPILIEKAKAGEILSYKELDELIHERNPETFGPTGTFTKYGRPCGHISFTCDDMRAAFNEYNDPKRAKNMPPISAIVVREDSRMPGKGFEGFTYDYLNENGKADLPDEDYEAAVEFVQKKIFKFKHWDLLQDAADKAAEMSKAA